MLSMLGIVYAEGAEPKLQFNSDGRFTIVMFSDIQDGYPIDNLTIELMEVILDNEKPDFVMLAGDLSTAAITTATDFKKYVDQFTQPVEKRGIAWAHVFGNHDEDHTARTGLWTKAANRGSSNLTHTI